MTETSESKYCPACNKKIDQAFARKMIAEGIPPVAVLRMGINIMAETGCPTELLKPIVKWAMTQGERVETFSQEEQDRLDLLKWNRWATEETPQ